MTRHAITLAVRLATSSADVEAAQALRYRVFVEELGAEAAPACAAVQREWDRFDGACEHLLLTDPLRGDKVVGVYRLMDEAGATSSGGFASEEEFDLSALRRSGARLLELGRSCLDPDYRSGAALHLLWQGLAALASERGTGLVFGLASLPGTDMQALAAPLALLAREHVAPRSIRPSSRVPASVTEVAFDRREAALALPSLVKAYLRLGGMVGDGAFVDRRFGCTDVCMVLDARRLLQPPTLGSRRG